MFRQFYVLMRPEMENGDGGDAGESFAGADSVASAITPEALKELDIDVKDFDYGDGQAPDGHPKTEKDAYADELIEHLIGENKEEDDTNPESQDSEEESDDEEVKSFLEITHDKEQKTLSKEETIELAQKGFDYTQKMQNLADERKEFEQLKNDETEAFLAERDQFRDDLDLKQQWDFTMDSMKADDPDLFDQVQEYFQQTSKHFANPIVNSQIQKLTQEIENLKKAGARVEDEGIRNSFNKDLTDTKAKYEASFKEIGFEPDWDKVTEAYKKGAENVERALFAVHGPEITTLYSSKAKLSTVKSKVAASRKTPTSGSVRKSSGKFADLDLGKMSYDEIAQKLSGR